MSQKKRSKNPKSEVFFTKSNQLGMRVIVIDKSIRHKGPRPVEMINSNNKKYSKIEQLVDWQ